MSEESMVEKFHTLVNFRGPDECWPWMGRKSPNRSGLSYGYFAKGIRAHRLAWQIANGRSVPAGLVVRHKCDNPTCVNPSHLEVGTQLENVRDMVQRGRGKYLYGSAHPQAKLTDTSVREIQRLLRAGVTKIDVAAQFGVSAYAVAQIAKGKAWVQLTGGEEIARVPQSKSVCRRGHALVYIGSDGYRRCHECHRENQRRYVERRTREPAHG